MAPAIHLVVIDDDPNLRESLAEGLPLFGNFIVQQANDGVEGLNLISLHHPDCVIVDIRMPHLDGYQLVRAIRGDAETSDIPLIMLSALSQDMNRLAGLLSGADVYLYKPVMLETLVHAIQETVRISREERTKRALTLREGEV
jgi:DNA-binding response OmpR family regulator